MIRKNLYKWHRVCSLIIAVPVLLWAASGFMHPIMTNLRPAVTLQSLPTDTIDRSKIKLTLQQALKQNSIDSIYSARLIHIDTNWFYQVSVSRNYNLRYISAKNGSVLPKGDWLYAQYLARLLLEGLPAKQKNKMAPMEEKMQMKDMPNMTDCCGEAASTVLYNKTGAPVISASLITRFDDEYKSIYCLLPVYKVQFMREDNIRLYVETTQDRLAIPVDRNRAAFTIFFDLVHTWGWLNFMGKGRLLVLMVLAGLGFLTAAMGLYLFFSTRSKKVKGNKLVTTRRNHRYTAVIASVFTLMFTFSGCYQAFFEFKSPEKEVQTIRHAFAANNLKLDLEQLRSMVKAPVTNISLAALNGKTYWQVYLQNASSGNKNKDLMKDLSADAANVTYIADDDRTVLPNGDKLYAQSLATQFSGYKRGQIIATEQVTHFTDEYNFTDKRLPVWKINYPSNHNERFYVETSTGVLAKHTNDADLYEGYSFALFHKHHYMDFAGKTIRDISTMLGAALQIMMVIIGLVFYFRWRKKKLKPQNGNS